jgi:hypothetical protein
MGGIITPLSENHTVVCCDGVEVMLHVNAEQSITNPSADLYFYLTPSPPPSDRHSFKLYFKLNLLALAYKEFHYLALN